MVGLTGKGFKDPTARKEGAPQSLKCLINQIKEIVSLVILRAGPTPEEGGEMAVDRRQMARRLKWPKARSQQQRGCSQMPSMAQAGDGRQEEMIESPAGDWLPHSQLTIKGVGVGGC